MSETNHKEITLKELAIKTNEWVSYLRSKWLIILVGCLCGVALGYLYATYKKPKYVAASTFALEDAMEGGAGANGRTGFYGGDRNWQ